MTEKRPAPPRRQNHLEYYRQHGIAPVSYDLSSMTAHLQRRGALYNTLGLPPIAFRGSRVLEVAAGTGHNSLYLAQLQPAQLVLLEPNATAVDCLRAAYAGFDLPHTAPRLVTETLEDFHPADPFDIVLCENWLGTSAHELRMLDKLAGMVAPGGVMVVTTVSPIGFVPNLLRRFMVPFLLPDGMDFPARSAVLETAFAPHLATLTAMTRSVRDWVQDNMLNPAYFGLCLSIPAVLGRLDANFEALGASPSFAEDWRWFKSLAGAGRRINGHFLDEYWRKAGNYLDHRMPAVVGDGDAARRIEALAYEILATVEAHEDACLGQEANLAAQAAGRLRELVGRLVDELPTELPARAALQEFLAIAFTLPDGRNALETVARMERFGALLGRETSYLSLLRGPTETPLS